MFEPRLIKVTCPHCGAGLQLNPQATVATCSFCQKSSFIHVPNRADPPAASGTQNYGHIHVSAGQLRNRVLLIVVAAVFLPIFVAGAIMFVVFGGALYLGVEATKSRPAPASTHAGQGQGGDPCGKAVACCKAVLGTTGSPQNLRTCEALRALPDADCKTQHETFRKSAKQLGQSCD